MRRRTIARHPPLTRRALLGMASGVAGAALAARGIDQIRKGSWMLDNGPEKRERGTAEPWRLPARPGPPTATGPLGLQRLGLDDGRDGLRYVPVGYQRDQPAPLILILHGAGGDARHVELFTSIADEAGLILLAPDSRQRTWDVLIGGYGPDVAFINRALRQTFEWYAVDPARMAVEGFSDGASYALSIGLTNGDLFTHVMAFSPGFATPAEHRGAPRLFISHGIHDQVLPIDRCSRRIVPVVQRAGYDVRYREFDGPHTIPPEIVDEALVWFTSG